MSHDEASDLLGAYALDAVDGDEHNELEAHLETCPRCRAELDSLREVAAAMGNSVEPVPEGLWSQIALRLPERRQDEEPPPMPHLASGARSPFLPPASGPSRRRRNVVTTIGAIAVAAAAVAVVLGIGLVRADSRVSNLQATQAGPAAAVTAALGRARAPCGLARLEHERAAGRGGRPALGSGVPGLLDVAVPARRPDLPAVGDRGGSADLPRSAGWFAGPGRLHHGRIDAAVAPEHHGRTGWWVRRPHRSDPRHRDCLTPARSC